MSTIAACWSHGRGDAASSECPKSDTPAALVRQNDLPIFELEDAFVDALPRHHRVILQAPTGSGKSTQIPQILLDRHLAGPGQIVVLQPRRLATRLLAARVARERAGKLGGEVGYQIRFENVTSKATRIRYMTEGVLLRQFLDNPQLTGVSAILFDEFHERHLEGDITLARALDLQENGRPDLKIVVMSATIDIGRIERFLTPCVTLSSEGRTFPVTIEYLATTIRVEDGKVSELAAAELERLAPVTTGDVLVFMPGAWDINRTIKAIQNSRVGRHFVVLPLHGELPPAQQDAAIAEYPERKVIVSTNVAETSLTIPGVCLVIDSGLARIARFDPHRGINTLLVEKISRAAADQRAGRAGRTAPGHCLRLWTAPEHEARAAQELPEVKRLDLAEVALSLKGSGFDDLSGFRWLEPPHPQALARAETLLVDLRAVEAPGGAITAQGRRMLAFPLHPRYASMLLAAAEHRCVGTVALIAALTQGRNLLRRSSGPRMDEDRDELLRDGTTSDFFVLLRAWRFAKERRFDPALCQRLGLNLIAAQETGQWLEHFGRIARAQGLAFEEDEPGEEAVARCVLAGFPDQVAVRLDGGTLRCAMVHGRRGVLARESVVSSHLLVATEAREVQMKGDELHVLLTLATAIREEWLRELFPDAFKEERQVFYDPVARRVLGRRDTRFHDLVLRAEEITDVPPEDAAAILGREVMKGTCVLKQWDHAVDQWIVRTNRVAEWFPEFALPRITPEDKLTLVEQICHGASNAREIKDLPVWPTVKTWLSPVQQQLVDELAPGRISLPNGRQCKVSYPTTGAPTIAVRIQDLYGVEESVRIARGRVTLVIEVLAPNHRPVQVTDNLATFWRESYPRLKQELQRKYPKHEWR